MRTLILLTLLAAFALPACASEKHLDAEKSQSIKDTTDATARSAPLVNTIPVQIGHSYYGKLEVYTNLQAPTRLKLTLSLPDNAKLINTYDFLNGVLARATTRRFPAPPSPGSANSGTENPIYTYDVFFDQDQIIGRTSSGDPGDTARIEPNFPDRTRIDQFLASTRASSIYVDMLPPTLPDDSIQ